MGLGVTADWERLEAIRAEALHFSRKSEPEELQPFSEEEPPEDSQNFTIKFGEAVLKKKEEIENIYKEEDKKKDKLKREFNTFLKEVDAKVAELTESIAKELRASDELDLSAFRKKGRRAGSGETGRALQADRKRSSMCLDEHEELAGSQPRQIWLKRCVLTQGSRAPSPSPRGVRAAPPWAATAEQRQSCRRRDSFLSLSKKT